MKNLIIFLSFIGLSLASVAQNDTTRYTMVNGYGFTYNRLKAKAALVMPADTVQNKLQGSIVVLNDTLYVRRATRWEPVSGGGAGIPSGGTTGQILAKDSDTSFDVSWIDNYTEDVRETVKAATSINKGQAVYVSGADGTNVIVSKASNATEMTSSKTLGLLYQNLATNGTGFVIISGRLDGLNTSGATAGDPVWLGTNGNLLYGIANKPVAPAHMVYLGVVTRVNANNGEIFVHVQNGFEIDELHDVLITDSINNQILAYDSTTRLWKNKTIVQALGYTPVKTTDTASMLSPYLRKVDTTAMLSPYARTATVNAQLATKVNVSDTASMLTPYFRKADTATLSNRINLKLNISDTSNMLSPYLRSATAAATYQPILTNPITGTGLSTQIPYFTGTTTLAGSDSLRYDITNRRLHIGVGSDYLARVNIRSYNSIDAIHIRGGQDANGKAVLVTSDTGSGTQYAWINMAGQAQFQTAGSSEGAIGLNVVNPGGSMFRVNGDESVYIGQAGSAPLFISKSGTTRYLYNSAGILSINSAGGNVGIGGDNPSEKLDITGRVRIRTIDSTASAMNVLYADATGVIKKASATAFPGGTGTTNYVTKWTGTSALGNSQIFDNGTNVGIGTASPTAKLDVSTGNINLSNAYYLSGRNAANNANLSMIGRNTSDRVVIDPDGYGTNIGGGGSVLINPAGGVVGIGTATPDVGTILHTARGTDGTVATFGRQGGTINPRLRIDVSETNNTVSFNPNYQGAVSPAIRFLTQEAERLRIFANGRIFMGPTPVDNGYQVDIAGNLRTTTGANFATTSGNVGIGTVSPTGFSDKIVNIYGAASSEMHLTTAGSGTAASDGFVIGLRDSDGLVQILHRENNAMQFGTNDIERMRIAANGSVLIGNATNPGGGDILGVYGQNSSFVRNTTDGFAHSLDFYKSRGTAASPTDVANGDGGIQLRSVFYSGGYKYQNAISTEVDGTYTSGQNPPTRLRFWTNTANGSSTERMRITSAGNVGIGVTPSAWGSNTGGPVLEFANGGHVFGAANSFMQIGANSFFDGSNYVYKASSFASRYLQNDGQHSWSTASSGTAGATITFSERMRIFNNGRVFIGASPTDAGYQLDVNGSGRFQVLTSSTNFVDAAHYFYNGGGTNDIYFSTRGNNAGNGNASLLNTVSGGRLSFHTNSGPIRFGNTSQTAATANYLSIESNGNVGIGTTSPTFTTGSGVQITRAGASVLSLNDNTAVSTFDLFKGSLDAYVWNRSNGLMLFGTNNTERVRIFANGRVGINTGATDYGNYNLQVVGNQYVSGNMEVVGTQTMTQTLRRAGNQEIAQQIFNSDGIYYAGAEGPNGGAIFTGSTPFAAVVGSGVNRPLQIATNNTVRMEIDSVGLVGINTVTPTERLDVNGRARIRTVDSTATATNMLYVDNNGVVKKTSVPGTSLTMTESNATISTGWTFANNVNALNTNYLNKIEDQNSTYKKVTMQIAVYRTTSSFTTGAWQQIATLPADYAPTTTVVFELPGYVDGSTYYAGTTQFGSASEYTGAKVVRIDPSGNVQVRIGTVSASATVSGTNYVLLPINATWISTPLPL